ncbi:MAG: hypothetical protein PHC99_07605 [Methylococcales bacterium]|nr:hypothetical protein [Methylococcales bacterium]
MKDDAGQKFLPYHYPAIFDRTFKSTEDSQGVVCALLCATALEAFVHDFIGWYEYVRTNPVTYKESPYPRDNYLNDDERKILCNLKNEKRSYDKFDCFATWTESEQPYQDFKTLIKIRNSLAHLKSEELTKHNDKNFIDGYPKFLNDFFQRKIIEKPKHFVSWIELIETQEFCLWCQNATHNMIVQTIEKLPNTNTKKHFSREISVNFNIDKFRAKLASVSQG